MPAQQNSTNFLKYFLILLLAYSISVFFSNFLQTALSTNSVINNTSNDTNAARTIYYLGKILVPIIQLILWVLLSLPILLIKPKPKEYDQQPSILAWSNSGKGPKDLLKFVVFSKLILTLISLLLFMVVIPILFGNDLRSGDTGEWGMLGPLVNTVVTALITFILLIPLIRFQLFKKILVSSHPWLITILTLITFTIMLFLAKTLAYGISYKYLVTPTLETARIKAKDEAKKSYDEAVTKYEAEKKSKVGDTEAEINQKQKNIEYQQTQPTTGINYTNNTWNFQFRLYPGERVVECTDQNGLVAWITTNPPVDTSQVNECATEAEWESVMVSTVYPSTEAYQKSRLDLEFQIQATPLYVGNISSIRLIGNRPPTASPAPVANKFDEVVFMHNGKLYKLPYSYLTKNFRLISE